MKRFGLLLTGMFLVGVYWLLPQENKFPHEMQPEVSDQAQQSDGGDVQGKEVNPFSIEALRNRAYPSSPITREETVTTTENFTSYRVTYTSDGLTQYALMNIPRVEPPTDGFPVVVVNHGYIDPEVYSTEQSYVNTSAFYASNGFLVLKPDYRGHDRSEGIARTIAGRIAYAIDVMHLIESIPTLEEADPGRVFMYGHSMGGDVGMRVLEITDKVKGASFWAPAVTDFPESVLYFARKRDPERLTRYEQELAELIPPDDYHMVSVIEQLKYIQAPILIHHGTNDTSVPYSWGVALDEYLRTAGKRVTFHTYQGDNHDIAGHFGQALNRDVAFFSSSN